LTRRKSSHEPNHTDDHLLGGRVRHAQPRYGFRSGIEPVLLAASVPARSGERVLEGGSGSGAALLCLAARVAGMHGTGIEMDPTLVTLAQRNAADNGWPELHFMTADVASLELLEAFDHACANPPYHHAAGTPSPVPARRVAKRAGEGLLAQWAAALTRPLRHRGTLTMILPDALLPEAIAAFIAAGCAPGAMLPLWKGTGQPAKLVLLRGIKGGRAPFRVQPGLALHTEGGSFTEAAEAILRDGHPLEF
jgi:tRNA1Val (adenine37-N6)-methyltransferase